MGMFERHEFLESFDSESISYFGDGDEECLATYQYSMKTGNNLIFTVYMFPLEQTMSIRVKEVNSQIPIFDFSFDKHDVTRVSLHKENNKIFLKLFKNGKSRGPFQDHTTQIPFMQLMIRPTVNLDLKF